MENQNEILSKPIDAKIVEIKKKIFDLLIGLNGKEIGSILYEVRTEIQEKLRCN
jgi:hypothetical protein